MNRRPSFVPTRFVFTFCALLLASLIASSTVSAQSPVRDDAPLRIAYSLSMPRPHTHLFEVRIDVDGIVKEGHVEFQMPRWSPGRYGVFDFAKNVQEARATTGCAPGSTEENCQRRELPVTRTDTQTWRVTTLSSPSVSFSYKVFGDDLSGTFSQLDARHANYNGHSVFMYVAGHKPDPVSLKIDAPTGWRVVNGATTRADQREFQFANYDVFADTPTEIAPDWTNDEFKVGGKTYRVVVHSFGDEGGKRAALVRDVEKIVRAQVAMWNNNAAPDYDSYTFLFHFDPTAERGDGMEHLNSTQIIQTRALAEEGALENALGTASHEFFHVWNVKRLRPAGLGPWDFTKPVETRGLWIAEGFTNYYGTMMMRRAGLLTERQTLDDYAGTITGVENSPGSRLMSAEESSLLAAFLDRSDSAQRTNLSNTSISYYPKGEILGLVLDLLIRGRSRGRASLDDVMRRMYDEFYLKDERDSYYLRGRGYTIDDFARVTSEVAGSDFNDFFSRHVRRAETPPYEEAFGYVGLRLARRADERTPHAAGVMLDWRDRQSVRVVGVATDSPAQIAGLKTGDVIVRVGNADATAAANFYTALAKFKRGDRVPLIARRAGRDFPVTITLGEPDIFTYRIEEAAGATPEARARRAAWLKN